MAAVTSIQVPTSIQDAKPILEAKPKKPLMLLSLDGGGIWGLAELCILEEIMRRVKIAEGSKTDPHPADYFDMIGGTGTGGFIAILLVRLRWPVSYAKTIYAQMMKTVFSEQKQNWNHGIFKASTFEKIMLSSTGSDKLYGRLRFPGGNSCRTFVCALPKSPWRNNPPGAYYHTQTLIRTYEPKNRDVHDYNFNPSSWEAIRATTAEPFIFKPIDITFPKTRFGSNSNAAANNPIEEVIAEAAREFACESKREIACIVSIGPGIRHVVGFDTPTALEKVVPRNLILTLARITTLSEASAARIQKRYRDSPGLYCRLNVDCGLNEVELNTWEDLEAVVSCTAMYLEKKDVSVMIDSIVDGLLGKAARTYPVSHLERTKHFQPPVFQLPIIQPPVIQSESQIPKFRAVSSTPGPVPLDHVEMQVEEPKTLLEPQSVPGPVVIASQHQGTKAVELPLESTTMTPSEAVNLLLRKSEITQTDENITLSAELVERLGYHSLAINQAGAYIKKQKINDISQYQQEFEQCRRRIFDEALKEWGFTEELKEDPSLEENFNVFITWEMAFGLLSGDKLLRIDKERLLGLMGFFDHSEISDFLFEPYASKNVAWLPSCRNGGVWDPSAMHEILSEMYSLSLLQSFQVRSGKAILSIHPLVQKWLRLRQGRETTRGFAKKAFIFLGVAIERHNSDEEIVRRTPPQKWFAHIDAVLLYSNMFFSESEMHTKQPFLNGMEQFASFFSRQGRHDRAVKTQSLVVKYLQEILGKDQLTTLMSMHRLSNLLYIQQEYAKAETICLEVIETRKRISCDEDLQALRGYTQLTNILEKQGKFSEAERSCRNELSHYKRVFGERGTKTLKVMDTLAILVKKQGRYKEAEVLCRDCMVLSTEVLGAQSPWTLSVRQTMAKILENQQRLDEAEVILRDIVQLLAKETESNGLPVTFQTVIAMNNLGLHLKDKGELAEAELIYRDMMSHLQKIRRVDDPHALTIMFNFAKVLEKKGNWSEAELLHREIFLMSRKSHGKEGEVTLRNMRVLAVFLQRKGDLREAEVLFREQREIYLGMAGSDHVQTIRTSLNLAYVLLLLNRLAEADSLFRSNYDGLGRTLGFENEIAIRYLSFYAKCLEKTGTKTESNAMWKRVEDGLRKNAHKKAAVVPSASSV